MAGFDSTLADMMGAVKDLKANCPADSIKRYINRRIRNVCQRRSWTDLWKIGNINIEDAVTTGKVSVTPRSNAVTGTNTLWPVTDAINTNSGPNAKVTQPGFSRILPLSMAGIMPGQWLYVDAGGPNPEAVVVVWTDAISFIAQFAYAHDLNFPIQASSLAGMQFRTNYPIFTVKAAIDAGTLLLDMPWAGPAQASVAYQILRCFVQPDPYCWRLIFAFDPVQGIALDVDETTYTDILIGDPQLSASENPSIVCPMPAGAGEVAQFFVYPPQTSSRALSVLMARTWPRLINPEDRSPGFISADVFVNGAIADALRTKVLTDRQREDPYFNPDLAREYEGYFERDVEIADEKDQALTPDRLKSFGIKVTGSLSLPYYRTHTPWPSDFGA